MQKYVYSFGGGTADGDSSMKDTLGGKGAGLAEMCRAGIPCPAGFTIATDVCNIYFQNKNSVPDSIDKEILAALKKLEAQMGQKLGDPSNPLLLSVRSGAKFSMPGMMNTILNLGNERRHRRRPRQEVRQPPLRLRLLSPLSSRCSAKSPWKSKWSSFDHAYDAQKAKRKIKNDADLSADDLKAIIAEYKKIVKKHAKRDFRRTPSNSSRCPRDAVFRSWWNPQGLLLPQDGKDSGRNRHRRQRPGHGLRQHG